NCLWLQTDGSWHAAIIAPDTDSSADLYCQTKPTKMDDFYAIQEQKDTPPYQRIPAVARWDWDKGNGYNYIGVRCGDKTWCEIGQNGSFRVSDPFPSTGTPLIKGYYDRQFLSYKGFVSDVLATIVPGAEL